MFQTLGRVAVKPGLLAALTALEGVNKLGFQDKALGFELNHQAALWAAGPMGDAERAKVFAAAAKALGSDNEAAMTMLEELLAK